MVVLAAGRGCAWVWGFLALSFHVPGTEERLQREMLGARSPGQCKRRRDAAAECGRSLGDCASGSRGASRSPPDSPANCPQPLPRGLQGLAHKPDQWKAASSRLSSEGAVRPIEALQAPRSLPAQVPGPRLCPHATGARGTPAPPPGRAVGWAARAKAGIPPSSPSPASGVLSSGPEF